MPLATKKEEDQMVVEMLADAGYTGLAEPGMLNKIRDAVNTSFYAGEAIRNRKWVSNRMNRMKAEGILPKSDPKGRRTILKRSIKAKEAIPVVISKTKLLTVSGVDGHNARLEAVLLPLAEFMKSLIDENKEMKTELRLLKNLRQASEEYSRQFCQRRGDA